MDRSFLFTCLAAPSFLAAAALANQSQPVFDTAAARAADATSPFAGPIFDQPGDGAIWVHGLTYKAKFDRRGFEYIPFLGSDAPQDYPIDFTIESARVGSSELAWQSDVEPELDGETVTFHRGAFDEVYVVRADSIEQNFVVRERRTSGDLHVVVHTESELERADGATGTAFANELGGVQVGKATIRDARGRSVASLTHLAGESIEILVPQQELETASFPLAIDPLISTWTVTLIAAPTSNYPDTSYDWWTNTWLCVNQETFSASDHDIIARQFTTGGTMLNQIYIEQTAADWTRPRVANNKSQHVFMAIAEVAASSASGSIQARAYAASTHALGAAFVVSPSSPGHKYWCPDIGGDTAASGTPPFCAAFLETPGENGGGATSTTVRVALISPFSHVVSSFALGDACAEPVRVSKSDGSPAYIDQHWNVAWPFALAGGTVRGEYAQVYPTGGTGVWGQTWNTVGTGYNALSVTSAVDGVGYSRAFAIASTRSNTNPLVSVEAIWPDIEAPRYQFADAGTVQPSGIGVETDGVNFYCTYSQLISGPFSKLQQNNIYMNEFHPDPNLPGVPMTALQSHVVIAGATDDESMPSLASMHSSGGGSSYMLCIYKRIATLGGGASILASTLY